MQRPIRSWIKLLVILGGKKSKADIRKTNNIADTFNLKNKMQ
jgi:hypothetical protein